jgi:hypothetical protein
MEELRSIAHLGKANPAIDQNYFPNTQYTTDTKRHGYWSSSPDASDYSNDKAWNLDFSIGFDRNNYRSHSHYVRLVRGNRSFISSVADVDMLSNQKPYIDHQWQESRYINHNDGTVTDIKTGLMWKQCSEGLRGRCTGGNAKGYTYKQAIEHAENTTFPTDKYRDWRLPNIKELASLVAYDRHYPAINSTLFPRTPTDGVFLSSSPVASDSSKAWMLYFYNGGDAYINSRNGKHYVRLVRGE